MAQAFDDLCGQGILHNDIKPANILYHEERGAILIDFGLASYDKETACDGGTPWYVAPEFLDRAQRKAAAEVWALGIVMVYLLGLVPLPDLGRQVKSWAISNVRPTSQDMKQEAPLRMLSWLQQIRTVTTTLDTTDPLDKVVSQMLSPDPRERIKIHELREAVRALGHTEADLRQIV